MMRIHMAVLMIVFLLVVSCAAVAQSEADQWQFSAVAGFGAVPTHWDLSFRVYDSPDWAAWIDGFYSSRTSVGAGLSGQYKKIELPMIDAVGAGVLYDGNRWAPTIYAKKTIASF